jgi:hypothetical protein
MQGFNKLKVGPGPEKPRCTSPGSGLSVRRITAFFICVTGLMLPHWGRIFLSDILGWAVQLLYLLYFKLLKFILSSLSGVSDNNGSGDDNGSGVKNRGRDINNGGINNG